MTNSIVTVNVSQQIAPLPPTLQQTGAMISQGATTTAAGTKSLLTQFSDLTAILKGALALSTLTWASNLVTVTTAVPHGLPNGDVLPLTIAGATPSGYNGTYTCTVTGASTFTYPLTSNPGSQTVPGVYTPEDVAELVAMATTFFAQGSGTAVYVLELGAGDAGTGVTYLTTWIAANPATFYSYLVPRYWDADSAFLAFLPTFNALTAKTYFYVTTTAATYTNYPATWKCVKAMVEAPSIPATEFSHAADFQHDLSYAPSPTNKVTPNAFCFLFGVTPYPTAGNATLLASLKTAGVNVVGTGAQGGISNAVLFWGTTMDGRDFTYWYSVDWVQINGSINIANAVINGSNNPANPLYYNQNGIDRLQGVGAATFATGVTVGLVLGTVTQTALDGTTLATQINAGAFAGQAVINAVPFATYGAANPNDYKEGLYGGFTGIWVPARGFTAIVFNFVVTDFVTQ